jgi:hypothetical protein
MAHKTNSKEQYVFKFHKFRATISTRFASSARITSLEQSLVALLMTKNVFPIYETNILLLKHYTVLITMSDANYFNFYKFVRSRRGY